MKTIKLLLLLLFITSCNSSKVLTTITVKEKLRNQIVTTNNDTINIPLKRVIFNMKKGKTYTIKLKPLVIPVNNRFKSNNNITLVNN